MIADLAWDESIYGSKLIIEDNGKFVRAPNDCIGYQFVTTKVALENKGILVWDLLLRNIVNLLGLG